MSGINRNILQNGGIPLSGKGQTNLQLVTTEGSRYVMLNLSNTFLSSSSGGTCEGITLQWTPDSTLGFETSSVYNAVTQSTLLCEPSDLSPLTSSFGWEQNIQSTFEANTPQYYIRAYQNLPGGGQGPYSNIVSIQTNMNQVYGGANGSALVTGENASQATFDANSFDESTNTWYSNFGGPFSASFSATPTIIKLGGPNYDAIKTNGATITSNLFGTYLGMRGSFNGAVFGIALCSGSANMSIGGLSFGVTATDSSSISDVSFPSNNLQFAAGINTRNKIINLETFGGSVLGYGTGFRVDDVAVGGSGNMPANQPLRVTDNFVLTTSEDCVIRLMYVTTSPYSAVVYHQKFG
jgi:hypothetical protein